MISPFPSSHLLTRSQASLDQAHARHTALTAQLSVAHADAELQREKCALACRELDATNARATQATLVCIYMCVCVRKETVRKCNAHSNVFSSSSICNVFIGVCMYQEYICFRFDMVKVPHMDRIMHSHHATYVAFCHWSLLSVFLSFQFDSFISTYVYPLVFAPFSFRYTLTHSVPILRTLPFAR